MIFFLCIFNSLFLCLLVFYLFIRYFSLSLSLSFALRVFVFIHSNRTTCVCVLMCVVLFLFVVVVVVVGLIVFCVFFRSYCRFQFSSIDVYLRINARLNCVRAWPLVRIHMFYGKRILCDYFLPCRLIVYQIYLLLYVCRTFKLHHNRMKKREWFLFEFFLFYLLFVSFIAPHFTHLVFAQLIQSLVLTLSTHTTRPMTKKKRRRKQPECGWVCKCVRRRWEQQRILHRSVSFDHVMGG